MRLQDQVAIVTGGSQGIGRAIARAFVQEGAAVMVADIDHEQGEATCRTLREEGGRARFMRTDVAARADVDALVQETVAAWGRLDILVNNAALLGPNGPFLEVEQEMWDRVIAVNQTGVFHCSQAAARVMAPARRGVILNIASVNAYVPQPGCIAYGAAKGALLTMTTMMAEDLAPYGIRANAIAPGIIQSHAPDGPPEATELALAGRAGLPHEVAQAAVFLVSGDASYVNGQCLTVDGGLLNNGYSIYGTPRPRLSPPQA